MCRQRALDAVAGGVGVAAAAVFDVPVRAAVEGTATEGAALRCTSAPVFAAPGGDDDIVRCETGGEAVAFEALLVSSAVDCFGGVLAEGVSVFSFGATVGTLAVIPAGAGDAGCVIGGAVAAVG